MDLQKLAEEINECYGPPFLPEGFVKARVTDAGMLWFDIGDRNGEFSADGERVGSGTAVGEGKQWEISHLPELELLHIKLWPKVDVGKGERYRCDMCGILQKNGAVIYICPTMEGLGYSLMRFCESCYREDLREEIRKEINRIRRQEKAHKARL